VINLNLSKATRIGLNLVALLGAVVLLRLGQNIFVPMTIAVMLAAILWPATTWLKRRLGLNWAMATFASVCGLVVVNVLVIGGFAIAVPRMIADLPTDPERQNKLYKTFHDKVHGMGLPVSPDFLPENPQDSGLLKYIRKFFEGNYITDALVSIGGFFGSWLVQGILILFILLFLLLEGNMLARRIKEIFGPGLDTQSQVGSAINQIANSVRNYLVWRTLVNIWLGIILGVAYSLLDLHHAWTWALLTMILSYIPYLGTIVAGVPPVLDAMVNVNTGTALAVLVGYTIVVTIEGYLIIPLVMGRSMDLNATTVMVSCLFWDLVWGTPGLFLAMPLMASVKAVCMNVPEWRPWANLMGTEEGLEEQKLKDRLDRIAEQSDGDKTIPMDEPDSDGLPKD